MERSWREGVIVGLMSKGFEKYPTYRIWLLYEAEETMLECKTSRLKLGDWVAVPSSESGSYCTSFITIPQILPTEVTLDDIVWIKTTVVFDDPTKVERIEQDSFIVHARYFGRVAAFSSFSDAVAGVPYNGIRVQRIPEKFSHMGVSWFIPPQPLSHPSRMQFHQGAVFGAFDGVVVSRHANAAYFWTPLLGEGICLNGQDLDNGDWVKFHVPAWSLHKKFANPNIHFQVAKWEMTDPILESFKCRNSVQLQSTVKVGEIACHSNGMLFAEWVGPITDRQRVLRDAVIDAGPAHWNKTAVVLLERIKKSLEEPITSWNVKKAWLEFEKPKTSSALMSGTNKRSIFARRTEDCLDDDGFRNENRNEEQLVSAFNSMSANNPYRGWTDEERCCDDQFGGACASSQVDRTTRKAYDVVSHNTVDYERPEAKFSRNTVGDEWPDANGLASSAGLNRAYEEEEKLARAVDVMGMLFKNAEVRAAILRNCPADYARLCRYYRFTQ